MSASPSTSSLLTTTTVSDSSNSLKELCTMCKTQPYDIICTCGDKYDFTCLHGHVELMGLEFQFLQVDIGERLLKVEQIVEDNNCTNANTIIENWRRQRIADINDIADVALNSVHQREKAYSDVAPFRTKYNFLCEESHHVAHEQLDSMIRLQQQIQDKSEEFESLPEFFHDDINLDSKLQSRLNQNILNQNESKSSSSSTLIDTNREINNEPITPIPKKKSNINILMDIEPTNSTSTTSSNESSTNNIEPTVSVHPVISDENLTDDIEQIVPALPTPSNDNLTHNKQLTVPLSNNYNNNNSTALSTEHDEFEAGQTISIQRQNPIIIPTNIDKFASTICCYENQLIYNDYNPRNQTTRITFIPDITQPINKQIINWNPSEVIVGGGDDDWIQDIAYSTKLHAYLLLNRSRLRLLSSNTHQLEEFTQFPDRSMKRVACNETFIYLVTANGVTSQNGDEIILLNYDKEEIISKTFRDLILRQNNQKTGPLIGELSDIAVNKNGQILFSYRYSRRQEVGVCMFNIANNGNDWTLVKRFLLNECWHNDLSYTPRMEWCEKLNVFFLIEYMTSHLIILDLTGQIKGETRFSNVQTHRDGPLNLSISTNDWLSVRYETSINIHRIDDDRL